MALSKDFVAASSTPLILSILSQGDSYGYAIIQRVRELSEGKLQWADGMLYPILHRLEKKSFIDSFSGVAENGRKRKYYKISEAGVEELSAQRESWRQLSSMLEQLEES
ncbi:MAG: PadR family transcriptional regulator PadR [Paraglaciecola sp.]|jgi:PadR family transcriptional regulator PadR